MRVGKTVIVIFFLTMVVFFYSRDVAEAFTGCPLCQMVEEESCVIAPADPAMRGRGVEQLQLMLKDMKLYNGPVKGIYDSDTIKTVRYFQETKGIKPNGVVDETTWEALDEAYRVVEAGKEAPAPSGEVISLVDTKHRKLTILSNGEPFKQYPVAVGKYSTPTPVGNFKVLRKARNWGTGFGTRWIGLTVPWGIYGIHGTNKPHSIGSYASHGCIRMNNRNVEEIYPWVKPGTRVVIVGNPFSYQTERFRLMRRGARGGDVMEVQYRMQRLGYYDGPIDGIWGGGMERAVIKFREDNGLPADNSVDERVYRLLGL